MPPCAVQTEAVLEIYDGRIQGIVTGYTGEKLVCSRLRSVKKKRIVDFFLTAIGLILTDSREDDDGGDTHRICS
jgi:hypothetical protein